MTTAEIDGHEFDSIIFLPNSYKSQRITKTKSYGNNLRYTNNNVQKKNGKSYLLT